MKSLGLVISNLNSIYTEIRQHVTAAQQETTQIVTETGYLIHQKQELDSKQQLLDVTTAHFALSNEDVETLTSSTEPVNDRFFAALTKLKTIHNDCQVLLGSEHQTLGLDIMEQSSATLKSAFEKLYRWIQREVKTLDLENLQISSAIRRALRVLAERPTLFESCIGYLADSREHMLSEAFLLALTGSLRPGERPHSKPIELFAHDPMRYVGDMLAWAHSTTVSEREALEVLFISDGGELAKGVQAGLDNDPLSRLRGSDAGIFDGVKALNDLVNKSLSGVGGILRQRVEQVISAHDEAILAYRLANLINFYHSTFQKLLGDEAAILSVLAALHDSALKQFRALMEERVVEIYSEPGQLPLDLSAPKLLKEALEQLQELLKSYDTSFNPVADHGDDTQTIFKEALDPYLSICESLGKGSAEPKASIFLLNCLLAIKKELASYLFAASKTAEIADKIHERAQELIDYQHTFFLHTSGLHSLVAALAPYSEADNDIQTIRSLPSFQPQALANTSQKLDDFLSTAFVDATANLKPLQDLKLIHDITEEAAGRFCEDFAFVEAKLLAADAFLADEAEDQDQANKALLRSLFPRTSQEIRVLLS